MKNRVLVDTTIWISFFREKTKSGDPLEILLMGNAVWTCGIVIFEVLQGIKSEGEKARVLSLLTDLPYIEMTKSLWQRASEFSWSLKKKGLNLPLSDILIATIAIENDMSVYTLDNHFAQIPNLKLHPLK